MKDRIEFEISIPSDSEGFILLQCPLCGELFKITASDIKADDVYELWCPSCGLKSENYLTDEVIDLASKMLTNKAQAMVHQEFKKLERKTKNGFISFKVTHKSKPEYENPLIPTIDALQPITFSCCKRQAKISQISKLIGCYCPFCGVNYDEN